MKPLTWKDLIFNFCFFSCSSKFATFPKSLRKKWLYISGTLQLMSFYILKAWLQYDVLQFLGRSYSLITLGVKSLKRLKSIEY